MDKHLVIQLLRNYAASTTSEAEALLELKKQYPYSQALHALAAKVAKDHGLSNHSQTLQLAAVYCSDRSVLKDIMTLEPVELQEEANAHQQHTAQGQEVTATSPAIEKTQADIAETIDSVDLADTVISDLQKLSELKHNFEMLFDDHTTVSLPVSETNTEAESKESIKSRKARIIEAARALNNTDNKEKESEKEKEKEQSSVTRKKRKEHPMDELIEEIKTKEALPPEGEKQKEQIEIIEQFIKIQPSITNSRDRNQAPLADLNTIRSGEFGDNIVSETLVEILVKQGKKDRAIEVLKKLIWKYPQKKAYFASQIEDLKK